MRVGIVTTSYPVVAGDPAGHFVQTEVTQLVDRGHRVDVITTAPRDSTTGDNPRVIRLGVGPLSSSVGILPTLRRSPWLSANALRFAWRARQNLRAQGPYDRLVCHWLLPSAFPICAGLIASKEVVVHGSDARLLGSLPTSVQAYVLRRLLDDDFDFRCVSHELERALTSVCPELADRSRVEPSPIDMHGVLARDDARQLLGLTERPVALIVSRLIESKRVDQALLAARQHPDLQTVVIGEGTLRQRLQARFPETLFLGQLPRPQTLNWMAAADVLLSASREEGAPTVVREARALNVPVVAAPAGDLRDWGKTDPGLFLSEPFELTAAVWTRSAPV